MPERNARLSDEFARRIRWPDLVSVKVLSRLIEREKREAEIEAEVERRLRERSR